MQFKIFFFKLNLIVQVIRSTPTHDHPYLFVMFSQLTTQLFYMHVKLLFSIDADYKLGHGISVPKP